MPLGLLAKDSIADLQAFEREGIENDNQKERDDSLSGKETADSYVDTSSKQFSSISPNPQQAQEEDKTSVLVEQPPKARSPLSAYSGFQTEYDDNYYYHDVYAPSFLHESNEQGNPILRLLPCLFPWMLGSSRKTNNESFGDTFNKEKLNGKHQSSVRDEDELSNSSEALGERLSDKERQAVLARLRLAQPEPSISQATTLDATIPEEKGLLNGIKSYDENDPPFDPLRPPSGKPICSILKRGSTANMKTSVAKETKRQDAQSQRRSLFPSYAKSETCQTKDLSVSFKPMARVVTVRSKNDMLPSEKADIWWQRSDYEDFRKTGRIITKAMLQGGSEIWLRGVNSSDSDKDDTGDDINVSGDKWWHKFGHSRRGLEHVVSMDEGRQRQVNVRNAIQAVLDEQKRQKLYNRKDPEKLRVVSLHHTSWARDLALAAGASDADAVQSSFSEERKSREFYLLKMSRNQTNVSVGRHIPDFMQPVFHRAGRQTASPRMLDRHTAAQIDFRRRQQNELENDPSKFARLDSEEDSAESCEPLRDPEPGDLKRRDTLKTRAAGYSADEDEKVNMSAVLSGMGAVTSEPQSITA